MTVQILHGDCRELMAAMPDASVHCCVTSPPYFGLRDYATGTWEGGDADHEHDMLGARGGRGGSGAPGKQTVGAMVERIPARQCSCGAIYVDRQIGLEPSPDEYVANLVDVFREVRRVLRDDGTLWLNLGDSYAGSWGAQSREHAGKHAPNVSAISANQVIAAQRKASGTGSIPAGSGLKPKDLIGIPWMVAFALRADGWYLRQEIIWAKPNGMPESMEDRCTKSHEHIFLLAKSRTYFFDHEAIKEPCESSESDLRKMREGLPRIGGKHKELVDPLAMASSATNIGRKRSVGNGEQRHKRSVWTVPTQPYSGAHFATFPTKLIEPCILAGCPEGGTVLDPFGGACTTGLVADRLQRNAILCELNHDYIGIGERRIAADSSLFAEVNVA